MEQTEIYIYGCSGHGAVVADIAAECGYEKIWFLDDVKFDGKNILKFSPELKKADVIIAIGDNNTRKKLQDVVQKAGFNVVSLIHPSAVISSSAKICCGVVIMPRAVVNAHAIIKQGAIINTAAVVEHDCVIGEFAHISPNVALAGGVKVGDLSHVGIGSSVIQNIKIGANSVIGAGSVVVRDIEENVVAYGIPAKKMRNLD
ncbi:acetyltransferase [Campylobacter sp. RM16187]|uniref:acetyltransferase n=1 Tax=Campylobacter sp. RM16187 TaxID=1660063 RepID=UPI0021B5F284|nr:acetyltransferase [Campylobacter sp. RM16187]QKG29836.1 UDP-4-amino-4,6-dideoxy-alpha-D-N-acetyl-D-glucosamine N-acetyltransferase [Campylobacter sp. RM16187]